MKKAINDIPPIIKIPIKIGITTIAMSVGLIPLSFSAILYFGEETYTSLKRKNRDLELKLQIKLRINKLTHISMIMKQK